MTGNDVSLKSAAAVQPALKGASGSPGHMLASVSYVIMQERFIALREVRDATLPTPILPSLQVNPRGGRLPEAADGGQRYLTIPLDALPGSVW